MTSHATRTTGDGPAGRIVTGYTVLAWLGCFFAVIFAVNAVFIYYALGSFPGLETSSAYTANQEFNNEIRAAAEQSSRGWQAEATAARVGERAAVSVTLADRSGAPETHLAVTARLEHPTQTRNDRTVTLAEVSPGTYAAEVDGVSAGQWWLVIDASADGERLFRSRNAVYLKN